MMNGGGIMIISIVNALRPISLEMDETGTYADGAFAPIHARQRQADDSGSRRLSYHRDYVVAQKLDAAPRLSL
jgi:hypothetical protein